MWATEYSCSIAPRNPNDMNNDPYVALARKSLETYITTHKVIDVPDDICPEMIERQAGAFVSLHKKDDLRGCIGTIAPTTGSVAEEIIRNSIRAAIADPRFPEVTADELPDLTINVDVLGEIEDISSPSELDIKRYGVIVRKDHRMGLLLPDLDGITSVAQQIRIAKLKAGIAPSEEVELQRFEVVRHS